MISHRGLFVAEFDDDFQKYALLDRASIARRVHCYFLVAPSLVIHPAYLWQSPLSNDLVVSSWSGLLIPPYASTSVGDSTGYLDYMRQRTGHLAGSRRGAVTNELEQYRSWGLDLEQQAGALDHRFPEASHIQLEHSRDSRFRQLLREDLRNAHDPDALAMLVRRALIHSRQVSKEVSAIRSLSRFARDSPLVSVETFTVFARRFGIEVSGIGKPFRRRALSLYYLANVNDAAELPQLRSLAYDDHVANPYDPEVFWPVMKRLFGRLADLLATSTDAATVRLLRELKEHELWEYFREQYLLALEAVDESLRAQESVISERIRDNSEFGRRRVLRRLWRQNKVDLVAAVAAALITAAGAETGGLLALGGGGVVSSVGIGRALWPLRRFRDEFNDNQLQRLRRDLRRRLRILARELGEG